MSSEASIYLSNALANVTDDEKSARSKKPAILGPLASFPSVETASRHVQDCSDEELLLQVRDGSKDALSVIFRRHGRSVYNVSRRILKDDSEAEDLLQELFLFIFQKAGAFDVMKGSASSWIIQMAYHRAIDRRRYLGFRHHYNSHELDDATLKGSSGQISIDHLAAKVLLGRLREELSTEQQQTLELHFFDGYSFHEIAAKTGQTFGNVRNHYYRGLERLRSHIFSGKKPSSERIGTQ